MSTLNQRLDKVIINIKVISKLETGQRLLFKNRVVSIRNNYFIVTPIIRSLAGEDRNDVVDGLNNLLEEINRLVDEFLNCVELQNPNSSNYDIEQAQPLIMSLNHLKVELCKLYDTPDFGLQACKSTYQEDPETCSKIEEIIDNFKLLSRRLSINLDKINIKFAPLSTPSNIRSPILSQVSPILSQVSPILSSIPHPSSIEDL